MEEEKIKQYIQKYINSNSKQAIEKQLLISGAKKNQIDEIYNQLDKIKLKSTSNHLDENKFKSFKNKMFFFQSILIIQTIVVIFWSLIRNNYLNSSILIILIIFFLINLFIFFINQPFFNSNKFKNLTNSNVKIIFILNLFSSIISLIIIIGIIFTNYFKGFGFVLLLVLYLIFLLINFILIIYKLVINKYPIINKSNIILNDKTGFILILSYFLKTMLYPFIFKFLYQITSIAFVPIFIYKILNIFLIIGVFLIFHYNKFINSNKYYKISFLILFLFILIYSFFNMIQIY